MYLFMYIYIYNIYIYIYIYIYLYILLFYSIYLEKKKHIDEKRDQRGKMRDERDVSISFCNTVKRSHVMDQLANVSHC